ncbi:MAG: recombinase family protein [Deltaproteobacteria bacterium]|jgi:DNA invertase Pin-like site-specific DNA recombinase|nr:recombinase family protein [Deltaproteobacteria bacterium]
MKDWIDLVDLRDKHGIEIVSVTLPFDQRPAGKLNSNMLAAISQFYSDQLSIRTAEGVERPVRTGLFSGSAPYGYKNYLEGAHESIIDLVTFDRAHVLLGNKSHHRRI